jgi:hypothetical protein
MKRLLKYLDILRATTGKYGVKLKEGKNSPRALKCCWTQNSVKYSDLSNPGMSSGKAIKRREARMEFAACADEIRAMLARCGTKRFIHAELTSKGRFTMAYVTFCQILQRAEKRGFDCRNLFHSPQKDGKTPSPAPVQTSGQPQVSKPLPASGPRIVNPAKEPFPDPRKMSLEDGI